MSARRCRHLVSVYVGWMSTKSASVASVMWKTSANGALPTMRDAA
eukprot:gene1737-2007_t